MGRVPAATPPDVLDPVRPYRILLVEDDPADVMLIEDVMSSVTSSPITHVPDGVAALEYLHDRDQPRPDLIVLDLNLPRMNGNEVLTAVKSDPDLRAIPVVMLTTSAAPGDIVAAYRSHVSAYVIKPADFDDFGQAVRSIDAFFRTIAARLPEH
ncbi:response regulator [Streptosporangiaceae bacterium NEAU-GS5]|nr:response regulator [Streptosporangiaceae bacterium NEAU-GS5]